MVRQHAGPRDRSEIVTTSTGTNGRHTVAGPGSAGPVGYSLPLSPTGESAMLTPPPWHFSGEVVMVDYRVDPDAARRFLPPGLEPGADPGAAAAVFATWQWCSQDGAELTDPGRCQFGEFLILLSCEFEGRPMARCPYAWVDQAVPMMRGWVQGMPKQFGVIHQSRPVTVGKAGSRLAPGGRFDGALSVHGRRVVEASVTVDRSTDQPPALHDVPLAHTLVFPEWVPSGGGPRPRLVASEVSDVEFSPIWTGSGDLTFFDGLGDDFGALAPLEVGSGHVFSYGETLHGGRLLSDYSVSERHQP
uniref:Enduracididine biosynthesis enzyme MppR n=1 Tax=Streptomyces hygroscopicus TaxID=1912 RepID=Q643B8_STRHY|nr:Chain A, Enduracididine Biosynthesis Enzyme MppR with HEPES Buffer Bound [Streptomyces hygroscopicus]4JM3_B Chain B, Enduracididine Biosynthesis Enzyme MppR with HEPES Buffer Bound [Streptomyces hygroscopicus]4JMC_A Chain A, Enduracididine biosynthesis enzyme MppR complexed with pyruvate [Streptomyces hygroscopicus]4JMC_B Chain B, Enduracididine biosynthesis enzyme MppR complexed with pyruvate [Streptomyces hygroscopicus]4JMD_A Chain A, Enduracididine biosynthesis enzyme MppR complexed with 